MLETIANSVVTVLIVIGLVVSILLKYLFHNLVCMNHKIERNISTLRSLRKTIIYLRYIESSGASLYNEELHRN